MSGSAEENRMVNSIPRVSAGYRAQNVDQLKGDFTKGTRKGLFEELQLWFDGHFPEDGPKRFYFLSGGAGLGKSAIAHQLCTRLDDLDHRLDDSKHGSQVGASYFFIRGDGSLSSGHSLFPTLLHQLALSQPTLRPHIIVAVREYLQHGDQQNIGYACQYLLRKAFLNASMSTHPPVFLIIDGLDECKERDLLPKLLRSLLELARELPCLRIFVASRPEPHIMAVLTAPEACDVVHGRSLDDTLDELKGDVRLYLEETVPRIPSYAAFLRHNLSALERLSIRAAGVFIYARIAVRLLETYRDHPEEQFELLFSSGGAPWLSPLDALYLQVLRSAFPPAELRQAVPARRERLLSLLQIITLVSSDYSEVLRPSRIVLLGSGLSEDDVATMVDSLRSVLFINNGGQVTPLHATFREFLIDKDRCVDSLYHVDAAKGHTRLASACLAAFSAENVTEFLADLDSAVGGYVHYAVVAWSYHLRDAEPNTALENHLRTFLQGAPRAIHQRALSRLVRNSYFIALLIRNMAQFLKVSNEPFPGIHRSYLAQVMLIHIDLQASRQATELCSGYAKFTAYSICWYLEVAQNPDTPLDQLNPDLNSAVQELSKIGGDFELRDVELDLVLQHTDMERYQAAHAALAREISQDARTRELWFPRQFMSTGSSKKTENKGREGGQGRLRRY